MGTGEVELTVFAYSVDSVVGLGLDLDEGAEGREVAVMEPRREVSWSTAARSLLVRNLLRSSARVAAEAPWREVPFTIVTFAVRGCS